MRHILLTALLVGCGGSTKDQTPPLPTGDTGSATTPDHVFYTDVGYACLADSAADYELQQDLPADSAAWVVVNFGERGGCDTVVDQSCTATLNGNVLEITATAELEPAADGITCTSAVYAIQAACQTVPLAAGDYTMSYAGESGDFAIPHSGPSPCTITTPN